MEAFTSSYRENDLNIGSSHFLENVAHVQVLASLVLHEELCADITFSVYPSKGFCISGTHAASTTGVVSTYEDNEDRRRRGVSCKLGADASFLRFCGFWAVFTP